MEQEARTEQLVELIKQVEQQKLVIKCHQASVKKYSKELERQFKECIALQNLISAELHKIWENK